MSYATAITRLIEIVKGETPATDTVGLGSAFRHEATHAPEASARHFWIQPTQGRIWGPVTTAPRHYFAGLDLVISYPVAEVEDKHALALAMMGDYEALSEALITVSNWDQSTSKIQQVGDGSDTIMPYTIEDGDARRYLIISFPLRYKN